MYMYIYIYVSQRTPNACNGSELACGRDESSATAHGERVRPSEFQILSPCCDVLYRVLIMLSSSNINNNNSNNIIIINNNNSSSNSTYVLAVNPNPEKFCKHHSAAEQQETAEARESRAQTRRQARAANWVFGDVVFQDVGFQNTSCLIIIITIIITIKLKRQKDKKKNLTHISFRCGVPTPSVFEDR